MMQKLFSQEIRFKDEDGEEYGEWEESKLGDVCSFYSGGTPSSKNLTYYNGVIPFIKSGEINSKVTEDFLSEEGLKNSSAKMVTKGDVLYALYGATSGEVGISKINGAINQAVLNITSETIDNNYIYYILKYNKKTIIKKYLQGGQGNLSANIVKSLNFNFPSILQQEKIVKLLSTIDYKVQKEEEKLEFLKELKKGLMQKMFI